MSDKSIAVTGIAFFCAAVAAAAPPRIVVQAISAPGASPDALRRDKAVALLMGKTISENAGLTEPSPRMIANLKKCQERPASEYLDCVALQSPMNSDSRPLVAEAGVGTDALLVCVFSPTPIAGLYHGVYYLIPPSGMWESSSFRVFRSRGPAHSEVMVVRAILRRQAAQLGLQVGGTDQMAVAVSESATLYADGIFPIPDELK